ncbi:AlpA family phage regulatory protein [Paracoccus nototheniae]
MNCCTDVLPSWLSRKHFCTNKDLQRFFDVSRATIDRWSRERPNFPKKFKLSDSHGSITRFLTSDVRNYIEAIT